MYRKAVQARTGGARCCLVRYGRPGTASHARDGFRLLWRGRRVVPRFGAVWQPFVGPGSPGKDGWGEAWRCCARSRGVVHGRPGLSCSVEERR